MMNALGGYGRYQIFWRGCWGFKNVCQSKLSGLQSFLSEHYAVNYGEYIILARTLDQVMKQKSNFWFTIWLETYMVTKCNKSKWVVLTDLMTWQRLTCKKSNKGIMRVTILNFLYNINSISIILQNVRSETMFSYLLFNMIILAHKISH